MKKEREHIFPTISIASYSLVQEKKRKIFFFFNFKTEIQMFTLPLAATTRHLRMQEGAGLTMETGLQTSAVMQTKRQRKVGAERKGDGTQKSTVRA